MLTLFVQAKVAPVWHIAPVGKPSGEAVPTTVRVKPPAGVEPVGALDCPDPTPAANGLAPYYEGTVTFRQRLRIKADAAPGRIDVTCDFGYQACDPFSCRPPAAVTLTATAAVAARD
jgi:hypothetical protein